MSKHTPGPWGFRERAAGREIGLKRRHWEAGQPNGFGVAIIFGADEANARLIAAAPDLYEAAWQLEAAESARTRCEACNDEGEPEACEYCFPRFDHARLLRRAAIAKVEGREPVLSSAQRDDATR